MLERATNRPRLLAANERMEIILGKRIEEVERERISRRDGLSGAIYRAWGCETGRALTLDDTFFFFPSLFSVFLLGNGRRAKKGNPRGNREKRIEERATMGERNEIRAERRA